MKVISIKQPWASLIVTPRKDNPSLGIKDIENRTWKTKIRGTVLIHTSAKPANNFIDTYQFLTSEQFEMAFESNLKLGELSAIIGSVDIVDCVINYNSIWAEKSLEKPKRDDFLTNGICRTDDLTKAINDFENSKPIYNWVLANPVLFEKPILNVKGKLNFWNYNLD